MRELVEALESRDAVVVISLDAVGHLGNRFSGELGVRLKAALKNQEGAIDEIQNLADPNSYIIADTGQRATPEQIERISRLRNLLLEPGWQGASRGAELQLRGMSLEQFELVRTDPSVRAFAVDARTGEVFINEGGRRHLEARERELTGREFTTAEIQSVLRAELSDRLGGTVEISAEGIIRPVKNGRMTEQTISDYNQVIALGLKFNEMASSAEGRQVLGKRLPRDGRLPVDMTRIDINRTTSQTSMIEMVRLLRSAVGTTATIGPEVEAIVQAYMTGRIVDITPSKMNPRDFQSIQVDRSSAEFARDAVDAYLRGERAVLVGVRGVEHEAMVEQVRTAFRKSFERDARQEAEKEGLRGEDLETRVRERVEERMVEIEGVEALRGRFE
ncbi:MAG: hypothetical protein Q8P12_06085, partial [bacterium]|nr:hypothetical protein [bacterium]